jgi:hypothetical protein
MSLVYVHIGLMIFCVGIIFLADKEGFAWVRGKKETLNPSRLRGLHYLMWIGLLSLIGTGIWMALPMYRYLLAEPLFIIKLLFVGILIANAILIGRLMHVATRKPFRELSWDERMPLFTSGVVSAFSWSFAIAIAFYIFS